MTPEANAIILAGGNSTRLGEDKAFVPLNGIPLLTLTARRLHHVAKHLIIAGRSHFPVDIGLTTNITFAPDAILDGGPLVGVYSGLLASSAGLNLVVACDAPFVRPRLLAHLVAAASESDADVAALEWDARTQQLPAVYKRGAANKIDRFLDSGERSLTSLMDSVHFILVKEATVREFDPEGRSFFNINTRDDLTLAERMLAERS